MIINKAKSIAGVILILLAIIRPGQSQNQAFSTFTLGVNLIPPPVHNSLADFWEAGYGLEGFVEMPFHWGQVQTGIHYVPYHEIAGNAGIPDFDSFLCYMQWGKELKLPHRLTLFGGVRLGISTMLFGENYLYTGSGTVTESEFTGGVNSQIAYQLHDDWRINLAANYFGIFTRKRIRLFFLSLGISLTFNSPKWLVNFIK